MKKYLLPIGVFVVVVGLMITLSLVFRKGEEKQPEVFGLTDYSSYPSILNMAPSSAYVGKKYRYDIAVVDKDTPKEEIFAKIVSGPKWIYADKLSIMGTPSVDDLGVNEVAIEISDRQNKVYETLYIVVSYESEN